jgi:Domain of unknown function (DUF4157)
MRGHPGPELGTRPSRIIAHSGGATRPAAGTVPGDATLPGGRLTAAIGDMARSGGRPLPSSTRIFLENRLGWPVDDVRVHTDASAGELADWVGARAFTVGRDVFFAPGEYRPDLESGRRLLGHEVVHVAQRAGSDVPAVQRQAGPTESRAVAGEQAMGFAYRMEEGWAFLTGPGGGEGHRWNEPGFDGIAYRVTGPFEMHILDNKSLARAHAR